MVITSISVLPHGALLLDFAQHEECAPEARASTSAAVDTFVSQLKASCRVIVGGDGGSGGGVEVAGAPSSSPRVGGPTRDAAPDTIVLITPHGLQHDNAFLVYRNSRAHGSAAWPSSPADASTVSNSTPSADKSGGAAASAVQVNGHDPKVAKEAPRWIDFQVSCELDATVSGALETELARVDLPVLPFTTSSEPVELRWGEVVPLFFLQQVWDECWGAPGVAPAAPKEPSPTNLSLASPSLSPSAGRAFPSVVILSLPSRRLVFDDGYKSALRSFAPALLRTLDSTPALSSRKYALVFSADLAHTHPAPLTHPSPPYPPLHNGIPEVFDDMIERFIFSIAPPQSSPTVNHVCSTSTSTPTTSTTTSDTLGTNAAITRRRQLVEDIVSLFREHQVGCCGLSAVVLLDEMLRHMRESQSTGWVLCREAYARFHPTYYGMLTAVLLNPRRKG